MTHKVRMSHTVLNHKLEDTVLVFALSEFDFMTFAQVHFIILDLSKDTTRSRKRKVGFLNDRSSC